ncbi:peptidoglycan editing factor PgeF [Pseudogemmobacter humi]|uniref:Purine nucleoside phosphorylase n=1 Tax=Pseudogemmobacter humi TaxID=2483812 RepID=A0A3P5XDQ9_9RHOB|nr:peptidoglycan editing factor PgeF [Pseudogemmobacter humi]VDC32861.1 Laccase domain protein YfiH [Pseudogemmobacter humi]
MLELITSDLIPFRHGFFTRKGGASSGIFAGLNCGSGSSDQAEIVAINRARVASAMEVEPGALVSVHQVHSPDVVTVTGPPDARPTADAMVTNVPGLALSVLTADCQPVLFAEPEAQVIGAAHAGWRGAVNGVLEATLDAMVALGAERGRIRAVIGPTISQAAYEVSEEFLQTFLTEDPGNARFFANGRDGRYQFDLPAYGLYRLREAGVAEAEWTRHCTYSDPARFFSYRRTTHAGEADYGRLIAAIRL